MSTSSLRSASIAAFFTATAANHNHLRLAPGGKQTIAANEAFRQQTKGIRPAQGMQPGAALAATIISSTSEAAQILVEWDGMHGADSNDWIAQYCVGADVNDWIEWTYSTGGLNGQLLFQTFKGGGGGCDYEFRYYHQPSPYTLWATSNAVSWPGGPDVPYQVHIAYGRPAQTDMTVSWTTNSTGQAAVLMIGTQSGVYNMPNVTAQESVTYLNSDMCQENANVSSPDYWTWPGYFHHAQVTGLAAGTKYYARPTYGAAVGSEISFTTAPAVGPDVSTRFVVYADMDVSSAPGSADTASRVNALVDAAVNGTGEQLDFLLHVGDLGYGEGRVSVWNQWMAYIAPYASRLPYHVSIGNHEYDYRGQSYGKDPSGQDAMWSPSWWNGGTDSGGECGVPTSRRFRMPSNGNGVFWYSFEAGNVHVAMISSEHDPSPTAPMGQWLAQDFASVDRSKTPWLLLGIHRPLYETEEYQGDYIVAGHLREIMEPLLLQYKVDVVLAGHYHSFMRTCGLVNGTCTEGAPVHYTTGAAGASLDDAPLYPSDYVIKYDGDHYGYSVVTAPNATAMRLQWFWNVDNSLQDDVWIYH